MWNVILDKLEPITTFAKEVVGDCLLKPIFNIIDQLVDDEDLAKKLKSGIEEKSIDMESAVKQKLLDVWQSVLTTAVAKEALWHTVSVFTFLGIITAYLINNLASQYWGVFKTLVIPVELWATFWGLTGLAFLLLFIKQVPGTKRQEPESK